MPLRCARGLDIVELLAAVDEGLPQAGIAKALKRATNEIYRCIISPSHHSVS